MSPASGSSALCLCAGVATARLSRRLASHARTDSTTSAHGYHRFDRAPRGSLDGPCRLCATCTSVRYVRSPCPRRGGALPSCSGVSAIESHRYPAMESQARACAPRRAGRARHEFLRVDFRLAAISRRDGLARKSFSAIAPMDTISGVHPLARVRHRVLCCVSFAALANLPGSSCIRAARTDCRCRGRPGMRW